MGKNGQINPSACIPYFDTSSAINPNKRAVYKTNTNNPFNVKG